MKIIRKKIPNYLENNKYDFTSLINNVYEEKNKNDIDFQYEDNYGIDDFEDINNVIMDTKLGLDEYLETLSFSDDEKNIIKLIYARKYYLYSLYDMGDKFIRSVESSKNKSSKVIKILNEIKINKRKYSNRPKDTNMKLSLNIKL